MSATVLAADTALSATALSAATLAAEATPG